MNPVVFSAVVTFLVIVLGKEYWGPAGEAFGPLPSGSLTNIASKDVRRITVVANSVPVFLFVVSWSVVGLRSSVGYLVFYLFWSIVWGWEAVSDAMPAAVIDMVGERMEFTQILLGSTVGFAFFSVNSYFDFMAISPTLSSTGTGLTGGVIGGLLVSVAIPASEEGFFRGFWLPTISEVAGKVVGLVSVSVLFGISHLYLPLYGSSPSTFMFAYAFGLIVGLLVLVYRDAMSALMAHVAFNTGNLIASDGLSSYVVLIVVAVSIILFPYAILKRGGGEINVG